MTAAGQIDLAAPRATYRLQFSHRFTIADGTRLLPYLHELGISHLYASPLLKARPGSMHGYDIIDHNALNPELGSAEDFEQFFAALARHGMGLILDFVPNHMGIGAADNEWWLDLLEWGQGSVHADYFDIEWRPRQPTLHGRVLLPLLGDHYGAALERGELALRFDAETGSFSVWYHQHRLPVRPRHYAAILRRGLARDPDRTVPIEQRTKLDQLALAFDRLRRPARSRRARFRAAAAQLKAELAMLAHDSPAARTLLEAAAASFDGTPGEPASFRALHGLLEHQHYRLAFWRVAADEINYRRFFNINDLAGIRMEVPELFERAHRLVARLIAEGKLHGLRLDHVDGLFDPERYFERLQALATAARPAADPASAAESERFYVVVEKVLARHEHLRESWPIAGTTGYEFIDLVNGLFVDPAGEPGLARAYRQCLGQVPPRFEEILKASKSLVIDDALASELNLLAHHLDRISEQHWSTRDYTLERLRAALKEIVVHFPVYRTYVDAKGADAEDRRDIDWAVSRAKRRWRGADVEVLDFVRSVLTTDILAPGAPYRRADVIRFAMKYQQYTGPVMAKASEDTAFYRYHRLISLNEVGGDPRSFGLSPAAFHHASRQRAAKWPEGMLATATHDTKRGEDARLRVDALSELADRWRRSLPRWRRMNRRFIVEIDGEPAPSPGDEYLIYQALVGFWPAATPDPALAAADRERFKAYLLKAIREAKLRTSWDNPNPPYEEACLGFLDRLFEPTPGDPFLAEFAAFAGRAAFFGMLGSLGQTVLKLTAPGVPDIYQGTELWDESLVDPDNRRPVDFERRRAHLAELKDDGSAPAEAAARLIAAWPDGRVKLYVIARLLQLRRDAEPLFRLGGYAPLATGGAWSERILAFARQHRDETVIVVVGRLLARVLGQDAERYDGAAWADTAIGLPAPAAGEWRELLTDRKIATRPDGEGAALGAADTLARLPVAVLRR